MQKINNILSIGSCLALCLIPLKAIAINCSDGEIVEVSGTVDTINTSATTQTGEISLTVQYPGEGGAVIFDESGTIDGEITSQTGASTFLKHKMIFDDESEITTINDHAILKFPPITTTEPDGACHFDVVESISNFSGTGIFENIRGFIFAEGEINFCLSLEQNANSFDLSGQLCLID